MTKSYKIYHYDATVELRTYYVIAMPFVLSLDIPTRFPKDLADPQERIAEITNHISYRAYVSLRPRSDI